MVRRHSGLQQRRAGRLRWSLEVGPVLAHIELAVHACGLDVLRHIFATKALRHPRECRARFRNTLSCYMLRTTFLAFEPVMQCPGDGSNCPEGQPVRGSPAALEGGGNTLVKSNRHPWYPISVFSHDIQSMMDSRSSSLVWSRSAWQPSQPGHHSMSEIA